MGFYYSDWVGDGVAEEFVAVFYLGYTQVYDLSGDSFEMIMTDHNTSVENYMCIMSQRIQPWMP